MVILHSSSPIEWIPVEHRFDLKFETNYQNKIVFFFFNSGGLFLQVIITKRSLQLREMVDYDTFRLKKRISYKI